MKTAIPGAVFETVASHVRQPSKSRLRVHAASGWFTASCPPVETERHQTALRGPAPSPSGKAAVTNEGDAAETSPCRRDRRFLDDGLDPRRGAARARPAAGESRPPSAGGDS